MLKSWFVVIYMHIYICACGLQMYSILGRCELQMAMNFKIWWDSGHHGMQNYYVRRCKSISVQIKLYLLSSFTVSLSTCRVRNEDKCQIVLTIVSSGKAICHCFFLNFLLSHLLKCSTQVIVYSLEYGYES